MLAFVFAALLKHEAPLLFPDVTYSFYPVYCRLFGIRYETVPLDESMRVVVADYRRPGGAIILANPNAPTGIALPRAEIARLLADHPDKPVVIDEAYVDFGAETAVPLIAGASEPAGRADDVQIARAGRLARRLRARRRGADRGVATGEGQLQFLSARPSGAGGRASPRSRTKPISRRAARW